MADHHDGPGGPEQIAARALVNAAGPWVSLVLGNVVHRNAPARIRMVKGSHIVVRRLFKHDRCYIFQNTDGRIVFAIPYEDDFTLIGTTDQDYTGDPAAVAISPEEESYLLRAAGEYFATPIDPASVVWRYSGVRPLRDDGASKAQEATRDYVLDLEDDPPLLSAFGGKITTYRRLSEAALAKLHPFFPHMGKPWTAGTALPGGNFAWNGAPALRNELQSAYPFLPPPVTARLVRTYGTLAQDMLGDAGSWPDLGEDFGAGLTEREADFLARTEWARAADDVLWRRTKRGLHMSAAERVRFTDWFASRSPG